MLQNFDVYFPVQLWVSRDGKRYRLEPPLLGSRDNFTWHPHFWDVLSPFLSARQHEQLASYWSLRTTVWGFNAKYLSLHRGFVPVAVLNNNHQYPFATEKVSVFRTSNVFYSSWEVYKNSFGFVAYVYPVPGTRLLYVQNDSSNQRLLQMVLCGDKDTEECPEEGTQFLPRHANKRVSCYDIMWDNYNLFLYVFLEKPRGLFFRRTPTGLCVPSEKDTDHKSMLACMQDSAAMRVLPNNVSTGSPLAELQQVMYSYPVPTKGCITHTGVVSGALFGFLLSLVVVFLVLFCAWRKK